MNIIEKLEKDFDKLAMYSNIEKRGENTWGYYKKDMQWVLLDNNLNIIKKVVNEDGKKSIYFDMYGYQPSTFKEHLDKDGKADPYAQQEYCESVGCPDCYYCVWVSHMHLPPNPNKPKVVKKEIVEQPKELTKWDKLVQDNIKSRKPEPIDPDVHPLFDKIMEVFRGEKI